MPLTVNQQPPIFSTEDSNSGNYTLTCAEYFAGIGLVRLGLEKAGWEVIFANDWAADKFKMYSGYFTNSSQDYQVKDIFSISPTDIPNTLLATASFPCIDLSLAGNFQGIQGQYSSAFWGWINILKHQVKKPKLILLENVPGWLNSNNGQDFRLTIQALNKLGYVCDVYAINAAYFLPQSRNRIFVIGVQTSYPHQNLETFINRSASLKSKTLEKVVTANLDLKWHFLQVPSLPKQVKTGLNTLVENLADHDNRWWSEDEVQRHLQMMSPVNLNYLKKLQNLPHDSYCTMYRRVREGTQRAELRKDGIAGCLRTARGGSSRQMLVKVGQNKIKMRLMTPREYARLQGVPDNYPLPSSLNQALTGFGDAVCVPVITWIAENILNPLVKSIQENTVTLPL
jgi:DNA (cytosine-5)-methyltransferase 1